MAEEHLCNRKNLCKERSASNYGYPQFALSHAYFPSQSLTGCDTAGIQVVAQSEGASQILQDRPEKAAQEKIPAQPRLVM